MNFNWKKPALTENHGMTHILTVFTFTTFSFKIIFSQKTILQYKTDKYLEIINMYIGSHEKLPTILIYSVPKVKNFLLESILTFLLIAYKAATLFKLLNMANPKICNHKVP